MSNRKLRSRRKKAPEEDETVDEVPVEEDAVEVKSSLSAPINSRRARRPTRKSYGQSPTFMFFMGVISTIVFLYASISGAYYLYPNVIPRELRLWMNCGYNGPVVQEVVYRDHHAFL